MDKFMVASFMLGLFFGLLIGFMIIMLFYEI